MIGIDIGGTKYVVSFRISVNYELQIIDKQRFVKNIFDLSSTYLDRGLALIIDIINPEMIVIGSIYAQNEN